MSFEWIPESAVAQHTFIVGIGEGETADEIKTRMAAIGDVTPRDTARTSAAWLARSLDRFSFEGVSDSYHRHYAMSAYQLLANTKSPRGNLRHAAAFPSRGNYCAHYLWDACFASIGVSHFNEKTAQGYILNLCKTQEADGKIPQFACSNWNRPGDSQPPLVGWAGWRLYETFGNRKLLEQIYEPVSRMVNWWFAKRDQDGDGIVEYLGALESGWDNSPRFDKTRIAGVDLNAYLNREMTILSRIAPLIGKPAQAAEWKVRRDQHAEKILARLYHPEKNLFFDRLVKENVLNEIKTPACFMPLWVDIPLDRKLAREMIQRHLLSEREFFGTYPFPVVAYDESTYASEDWWRGPVWLNIAWAMTEVLKLHGFDREHREAVDRLIRMMTRDLKLAELYNSANGAPDGCWGYGWTCSVFMELVRKI